jgi:glycosyltransferase involved in cell wall biosynthesis
MNILLIYQYCTFGGVERAILNRAMTFRKHGQNVNMVVGYLHDYGALQSFQAYIHAKKLDDCLAAFLMPENTIPDLKKYDFVFNIDTPQIFERTLLIDNMFVECHTPTVENRQYLKTLPNNIRGILAPSNAFKSILMDEFPDLPPIFMIPNPVAEDFFDVLVSTNDKIYSAMPLAYIARVDDELKNFSETASIFELFADHENIMFAVIGRGAGNARLLSSLENKKILGKTFLRDQIGFDTASEFVRMIKNHRGLFISSSKGESFGLSAAEFISSGVPVLLSDIGAHRELVNNDEKFLYPLGDVYSARTKINTILNQWEEASTIMRSYGQKFRGDTFITAWQTFLNTQQLAQGR